MVMFIKKKTRKGILIGIPGDYMPKTAIYMCVMWVLISLLPSSAIASGSDIVERHIFSPDETKKDEPSIQKPAGQAEKELQVSGIVRTEKGAFVMLRNKKDKNKLIVIKEGEEISGYKIARIGSNYIVVTSDGNEIVMNLYKGAKDRPAGQPEAPTPPDNEEAAADNRDEQQPTEEPPQVEETQANDQNAQAETEQPQEVTEEQPQEVAEEQPPSD